MAFYSFPWGHKVEWRVCRLSSEGAEAAKNCHKYNCVISQFFEKYVINAIYI